MGQYMNISLHSNSELVIQVASKSTGYSPFQNPGSGHSSVQPDVLEVFVLGYSRK
jgi:hypothetical protein